MKCLRITLKGCLSRRQRRAGGLILFLWLTLWRSAWCQSAAPPAPDTVRAALAHVVSRPALLEDTTPHEADSPAPSEPSPSLRGAAHPAPNAAAPGAHLVSGLQWFGQKTVPFRWVHVSGSPNARRAFESNHARAANLTELTVMGRLLDLLDVNVALSDNRYGTDNRRVAARFRHGDLDVSIGDVTASLAGNSLVPFQRLVRGAVVEKQLGADTRLTTLVSTGKSPTRRVTVPGNNTAGPYYLNAFPIEVESVRVRIDDTEVPRDAYIIDAYAGTITFLGGRIVPQTSLLRVHFAVRSAGGASGPLYGARLSHRFHGGHSIGVTAMLQETASGDSGGGAAGRERIDDWPEGHADSAGPYQLRFGPVVRGSERVFVGGVLQQSGTDYLFDADRGVIHFTRLILSSEPIRILYRQVQDGDLQDRIPGDDTLGPFRLSQAPIVPGSERITVVDTLGVSVPQARDRDYRIDPATGMVTFLQTPLSRGAVAVAVYRPRRAVTAEPAGRILGIDGTLRVGENAHLTAQLAKSGGEGASGSAVTLEGKVGLLPDKENQPRLKLGAAVKSIDPGFMPFDGGNFLRNDRGVSLDGEFAVNPYVRVYSRWQQSRRPVAEGVSAVAAPIVTARESVSGASIRYPGWPTLSLQSRRLSQKGRSGDANQASDSARLEYESGSFRAVAEWSHGETEGAYLVGAGAAPFGPARTETARLAFSYAPGGRFSISANAVHSDIRALVGGKEHETTAQSVDVSAVYRPSRAVQLSVSHLLSDSGTLATLAPGSPVDPRLPRPRAALAPLLPGAAGSRPGLLTGLAYGGNQRSTRLGLNYSPGQRLSLSATFDASDTQLYGETTGYSFGFNYTPFRTLALSGNFSRQSASLLGSGVLTSGGNGIKNDLTYLSLRAGPFGKLTFNMDYQHLAAQSRSGAVGAAPLDLANETHSWTGRLSHPIGGHTAFLQYQEVDYSGASLNARKRSATAGVELKLGKVLGLTLDMELHRYRDARRPADSYTARILSGNLSARF